MSRIADRPSTGMAVEIRQGAPLRPRDVRVNGRIFGIRLRIDHPGRICGVGIATFVGSHGRGCEGVNVKPAAMRMFPCGTRVARGGRPDKAETTDHPKHRISAGTASELRELFRPRKRLLTNVAAHSGFAHLSRSTGQIGEHAGWRMAWTIPRTFRRNIPGTATI